MGTDVTFALSRPVQGTPLKDHYGCVKGQTMSVKCSVKCCGRDRATRYCPDCGKKLVVHVLDGLLRHCKSSLVTAERVLQYSKGNLRDEPLLLKRQEQIVSKWQSWVAAIGEVCDG